LGWRHVVRSAAIFAIVTACFVLPWVIRNAIVFDTFIPGVSQVGFTLWGGTAPAGGSRMIGSMSDPAIPDSVRQELNAVQGEIEQSQWFTQEAYRIIREDPWRYVRLSFRKIPQLWLNLGFDEPPSKKSIAVAIFNVGAFVLAVIALRAAHPSPIAGRMLLILVAFWTLANLPATALVRYAMPMLALVFAYAGPGLDALWRRSPIARRAPDAS
jgi:hypothetical protein